MTASVLEVSHVEVRPLASRAARERVSLADTPGTRWWAAYVDGNLVGCGGIMVRGSTARMKGAFVLAGFRGMGIGLALFRARIAAVEENPAISLVEALSLHPDWYVSQGFRRHGRPTANGAVWVRRPL